MWSSKDDHLFSHNSLVRHNVDTHRMRQEWCYGFPKMGHTWHYDVCLVFLGCLPSEGSCHALRKPRLHGGVTCKCTAWKQLALQLAISINDQSVGALASGDCTASFQVTSQTVGAGEHSPLRHDSHITHTLSTSMVFRVFGVVQPSQF